MGISIQRERFEPEEFGHFAHRLDECLGVLRTLLARQGFGEGELSLGSELELSIADSQGRPLLQNLEIIEEALDPRLTVEIDRFNLECNLRYGPLPGRPFATLEAELCDALEKVRSAAHRHGGRAVAIGILPTLASADLQSSSMTDAARFRALSWALRERRKGPFELRIDGADPMRLHADDVTFEGAATSLQIHLRVPPTRFASLFNAVQLATPIVLAAACNSPTFLGHRLWDETRVALFKQAVDDRRAADRSAGAEARVSFGHGWVVQSAHELFAHSVDKHAALLPVLSDAHPHEELRAGRIPELSELRLHQGTIWNWNRPIYDPAGGGHLRIEMRALPSGPSVPDMVANTAFWVGLALGLEPEMRERCARTPFEHVHHDFYRAAQRGLDAPLHWLDPASGTLGRATVQELVPGLLSVARRGLLGAGVVESDFEDRLALIALRVRSGRDGARWQRNQLSANAGRPSPEALVDMLFRYIEHSESNQPVHEWED